MTPNDWCQHALDRLTAAGLKAERLVSSQVGEGYSNAIFKIGPVLVRVACDRGLYEVEFGLDGGTEKFFSFEDIEIGLGWTTPDRVIAEQRNDAIDVTLRRFADRYVAIADALSGDRKHFTAKRIHDASAKRSRLLYEGWEYKRIRSEAENAWHAREFARVVVLYESMAGHLSPAERAKLEFARKQLSRS
jgi:hypothetical protein